VLAKTLDSQVFVKDEFDVSEINEVFGLLILPCPFVTLRGKRYTLV